MVGTGKELITKQWKMDPLFRLNIFYSTESCSIRKECTKCTCAFDLLHPVDAEHVVTVTRQLHFQNLQSTLLRSQNGVIESLKRSLRDSIWRSRTEGSGSSSIWCSVLHPPVPPTNVPPKMPTTRWVEEPMLRCTGSTLDEPTDGLLAQVAWVIGMTPSKRFRINQKVHRVWKHVAPTNITSLLGAT